MFNTKKLTTMAKNNMLLGYARGKVGDLVFQRRKGEQIVKARNRNPANPRTWSQQMQRVRMYAPVQFYKTAIENFYKFAFEDKKYNETDYNAFIRENLNAFQGPYFTKEQVQQNFPVMAPYVISSGSLNNIAPILSTSEGYIRVMMALNNETLETDENTVANVSRILIARYNLQEGDMVTFTAMITTGVTISDTGNVSYNGSSRFIYRNFVIDTTNESLIPISGNESEEISLGLTNPSGSSQPNLFFYMRVNGTTTTSTQIAYAIITTRRNNGKILASRTNIRLNNAAQSYYETMSTSQQLLRAAASYDASVAALDPNSAKVMTESSSQTNVLQGRSTEQTAFNCLPAGGSKTTDGNPAYTLDNNCPSCGCDTPEPSPCGDETVTTTTTTTTRRSTTKKVEEE